MPPSAPVVPTEDAAPAEEIRTESPASAECVTCANRTYQDKSSDGGVSMQSPTRVDPNQAASTVRSHEQEHQFRDRVDAENNGREVVQSYIRLHTSVCAECGRVYVSGGTSTTISQGKEEPQEEPPMSFGEAYSTFG